MPINKTNKKSRLLTMLGAYSSHNTNPKLSSLDSQEPRLEASVTLGSGNGQKKVPDSFIGTSNGVNPDRFFNPTERDLEIPIQKPDSNLGALRGLVSPLQRPNPRSK